MSKEKLALITTSILIAVLAAYMYWHSAIEFYEFESKRGGLGYVSDETWYVSASRVILVRIFGAEPKQVEKYGVTVVFREKPSDYVYFVHLGRQLGVNVTITYEKIPAVYVFGSRVRVLEFIESVKERFNIDVVIPGWPMPDREGIHYYLNWEHPPLGKYLVALFMRVAGDKPVYWRIPVVTAGVLTTLFVFLTLNKLTRNIIVATLGALLLSIDSISRSLFSIALLDGYTALFTSIAIYLATVRRYEAALIAGLVGALFKASGLFTTIPVIILLARRDAKAKPASRDRLKTFINSALFYAFSTMLLYLCMLTLVSLPLASYIGVLEWFSKAIVGSTRWHLSVKCIGVNCPTSSAPWDWFLGFNSFPLYVYPDGRVLYASGVVPLWIASATLLILLFPVIYTGARDYGYIVLFYLGVFGGYILVWILGGKTQYSFYSIHLAPLVYINLVYAVSLLTNRTLVSKVINTWYLTIESVIHKLILY